MPKVIDPFGAARDPLMPQLALALDPKQAEAYLKRGLPRLSAPDGALRVGTIKVLRHKPGKRCIVEYRVRIEIPGAEPCPVRLIGKTRAKRFGHSSYRLQQDFWDHGFSDKSADGISVPEPLGHIPELEMWFQKQVKAEPCTVLFTPSTGFELAPRIADAIYKVHLAGVPTSKRHSIDDEVRILENCFHLVETSCSHLKPRLEKLWVSCWRLKEKLAGRPATGIHRDFYSDQVIIRKGRLYVIDFDLYCQGDPALDIGNFTAHLTEMSLRNYDRPDALDTHERAIVERYLDLAGEGHRLAIEAYHLLTLARHIFLSTQFEERRKLTEPILALCEQKFYSNLTL